MKENKNEVNSKIERIKDKVLEIQEALDFLIENVPGDFDEYKSDLKTKAACEHYFEKVVEACISLTFLIIKDRRFEVPEDEESAFNILSRHEVVSESLAKQLIDAKGMRNIIAHEYGKVDDSKVYHSLNEEIEIDVTEFLKAVKKYLEVK